MTQHYLTAQHPRDLTRESPCCEIADRGSEATPQRLRKLQEHSLSYYRILIESICLRAEDNTRTNRGQEREEKGERGTEEKFARSCQNREREA